MFGSKSGLSKRLAAQSEAIQKNTRKDGIVDNNVSAAMQFQAWVEAELTGDDQSYKTCKKVLRGIREFDDQLTLEDLQEVYWEVFEQ